MRRAGKPLIGITGPDHGGLVAWWFTARAVRRAGGKPLRLRPGKPLPLNHLDGLIIGGGADVSPDMYGQQRLPELEQLRDRGLTGWRAMMGFVLFPLLLVLRKLFASPLSGLDRARDELEERLIRKARHAGLPMLGICRGMQLLNVSAGGSLHQNIESFYQEHPAIRSVLPRKLIQLKADSRLASILATTRLHVNALHDQAIAELGDDYRVSAEEKNGVIQAVEHAGDRFEIGVQWHPEYLPQRPEQRALFAALVKAAGSAGAGSHTT